MPVGPLRHREDEMMGKPDILNSIFSFEKMDAILHGDDAFVAQVQINHDDNPVCNHFRQRQESNRILFPIWDTCTDNMVFVIESLMKFFWSWSSVLFSSQRLTVSLYHTVDRKQAL